MENQNILLYDTVAISNARLGLLVRDVETTWNNLAAIFTKTPYMVKNCCRLYSAEIRCNRLVVAQTSDSFRCLTDDICRFFGVNNCHVYEICCSVYHMCRLFMHTNHLKIE